MFATTLPARHSFRRPAYLAAAALLLAATIFEAVSHGGWGFVAAGLIGPDLALLVGGGQGLAKGQLHPRAVPLYNAVHRFWGPLVLIVAGIFLPGTGWIVGGLAWATHIALDRGIGYGLRTHDGFQRP
jgi:hypothetical protein